MALKTLRNLAQRIFDSTDLDERAINYLRQAPQQAFNNFNPLAGQAVRQVPRVQRQIINRVRPVARAVVNQYNPVRPQPFSNFTNVNLNAGRALQNINIPRHRSPLPVAPTPFPGIPFLPSPVSDRIGNFAIDQFNNQVRSVGNTTVRASQGQFGSRGNRLEDFGNALAFIPMAGRVKPVVTQGRNVIKGVRATGTQLDELSRLRTSGKNMATNVRSYDNPLLMGKDWRTYNKLGEALPWEYGGKAPRITQQEARNRAAEAVYNATTDYKKFRQIFDRWIGQVDSAATKATKTGSMFKDIPTKEGGTIIKNLEAGRTDAKHVGALHSTFDALYNEARSLGLNLGYRQNYITHYWQEAPEKVKELYRVFKQRGAFQNERTIPTYEEGISMGLKPKYNNPAQILTAYAKNIEQLRANINFFKELKAQGLIVPASVGQRSPGFVPLNAMGLPKNVSQINEQVFIGNYYAPQPVAATLNKVFNPHDAGAVGKVASITGEGSSRMQDIVLSGGIPKTPVNAFTAAQVQKELLSFRVQSPVKSIITALDNRKTAEFFEKNADQIIKMQERNVPVRSNFDISNLIDKDTTVRTMGEKAGKLWADVINAPTFQRFMPMLQVHLFNDIERQALKSGKNATEAADVAARAVKNFYGLTNTGDEALRSKVGKDVVKTIFFAPKFREAMIGFWINNLKALRHPMALENRTNIRFMAGAILTLGTYEYLNREFNGHSLLDNPPGKQDKLLIPLDDGTVVGIPYLSSIATIPRAIFRQILAIGRGDIPGAGKDAFQSYASIAIKPVGDVLANSDYFGKEITGEFDTAGEKLKKQGKYLATQYTGHPYVRELIDSRNQGDPMYQRLTRGMELPIRYYSQDSLAKSTFYDSYYKLKAISEKYDNLEFQDPKKAKEFYAEHEEDISRYYFLKKVQDEYYSQKDKRVDDPSILKISQPTGSLNRVGNSVIYNDNGYWKRFELNASVQQPKISGNPLLDKMAQEEYRDDLSGRMRDVYNIAEVGGLPQDQALNEISKLLKPYNDMRASLNKVAKSPISLEQYLQGRAEASLESKISSAYRKYQDGEISLAEASSIIASAQEGLNKFSSTGSRKPRKVSVRLVKTKAPKGKKLKFSKPRAVKLAKAPKIKPPKKSKVYTLKNVKSAKALTPKEVRLRTSKPGNLRELVAALNRVQQYG